MPVQQDRTEPATPRKREEAREEGKVAKSTDLTAALVLLFALILVRVACPFVGSSLKEIVTETLGNLHNRVVTADSLPALFSWFGARFALLCLPALLVTAGVGFAANVLQVGFRVTPKALAPDMSRLDPIKGLERLISMRSLVELSKSLLKFVLVGYVVYAYLKSEYPLLINLASMPPAEIGARLGMICWGLLVRGCAVILIIGVFDYGYLRLQFEKSLRMSKQEIKDEFKRSEGDPQVKGRIRQRQRDLARHRMIRDVAEADVVITNPTHIAVALRYDAAKMNAPTVVAKGQRLLAEKIKAVAEANNVPIVENKPIARLLYKVVEVGQQIPEDLYQAVAEILAYVFQLNRKAAGAA